MRALGLDLPGLTRKSIERRPYPPGQHGQGRRRKKSDYGRQLQETQKLRLNYGVSENKFRRMMRDARGSRIATGEKLLELLERRLDNVVFRAGFAPTIPAARQLVNHGHFLVNGKRLDIASYQANVGDVIQPRQRSMNLDSIEVALSEISLMRPDWLDFNENKKLVKVTALPDSSSVPFPVDVQLVIEFYSKRL
jgi:small subunit ribosomal protein S4